MFAPSRKRQEELREFTLKIRGQNILAHSLTYLFDSPELPTIKFFCRWMNVTVIDSTMHINQFSLSLAFENI